MQPRRQLEKVQRRNALGELGPDVLIREEPLRIVLESPPHSLLLATILRTPGDDFDLIRGYLFATDVISGRRDIVSLSYCGGMEEAGAGGFHQVKVRLRGEIPERVLSLRSPEWVHGGCGACGQEQVALAPQQTVASFTHPLTRSWLHQLPDQLAKQQKLFEHCGGVHAAAWVRPGARPERIFEDVGRHNAVDKLIGNLMESGDLHSRTANSWLLLSGRAGFELVQKAAKAGFSGVASLGPPSSLALRQAQLAGITLVGFLSATRMNIYCEPDSNRWVD